ncbi:type I-F CRISPR-associated helicase Cas3f [Microbulbifer sp.]|uniref:type I-F CRISPR-associated helicase Cas3f n=1 Tax=Microbulbifer sp. TaxID=1908541 RepID=UPI00258A94ED|nr:type I-F CRISPR-associated helicase Cas3f [Microbulbifer sp.]
MKILLVSQCNKNALKETRRVLDQFAERCGERTWQTAITQAGLDTLRKLLRKSARKNTAVACHWIRGRNHSELKWIVGDASRFNLHGAVPTNTTSRDILRSDDENDWHTGEVIALLAALAALMHDLGKACSSFQRKLKPGAVFYRNLYRHEWISLRLFEAFVGDDDDETWLKRLSSPTEDDEKSWIQRLQKDGLENTSTSPFERLPPLAAAVGWLIVTHHRLPVMPAADPQQSGGYLGAKVEGFKSEQLHNLPAIITAEWNEHCSSCEKSDIAPYWEFKCLPVETPFWKKRSAELAESLLHILNRGENWLDNPYVMHLARLSLMLADHHYSSLSDPAKRVRGAADFSLWANTNRETGKLNQPLDEHLLGVEKHSLKISRSLPGLEKYLPRIARHKGFRKRSANTRFRWQDKAFDLAVSLRERSREQGFFGINMASTGCGKTVANGRILYALADPERGARFAIALGLRTLTLQTGKVYREKLNLGDDDLAIRVGGSASRQLFEHYEALAEKCGSSSAQKLIEEDGHVYFEGDFDNHPVLRRLSHDPSTSKLVSAPILVCTVDHLVPATESQRGGRQIAPMLRLMSGDLVLDEIDDFDIGDLPALTRLVHWAGLLGSRVLLSSATLPPSLVRGLFESYRSGREYYQRNRGESGRPVEICCAWFDEHDRQHRNCAVADDFENAHETFASRRHTRLSKDQVRRRGELLPVENLKGNSSEAIYPELSDRLVKTATELHDRHHTTDPQSGKRISFGLIRMANIDPLFETALALYKQKMPKGFHVHLCVYHSQHPLMVRSDIERRLDTALDRHDELAVFELPDIRRRIDTWSAKDQLFIVLGSPVTEVGRDHDYDWAIVEPSSVRSLIQLAGRVRRHRSGPCDTPNLILLNTNVKHLRNPNEPAFVRPGFEGRGDWQLSSHLLEKLLQKQEYDVIDARPRIVERKVLDYRKSLVDLEHARLRHLMIAQQSSLDTSEGAQSENLSKRQRARLRATKTPPLGAHSCYSIPRASLSAVLPQQQPFRDSSGLREESLILIPDESGEDWELKQIWKENRKSREVYLEIETDRLERVELRSGQNDGISCWGEPDYMDLMVNLADDLDLSLESCALSFGCVTVPESVNGWRFHPILGFTRKR